MNNLEPSYTAAKANLLGVQANYDEANDTYQTASARSGEYLRTVFQGHLGKAAYEQNPYARATSRAQAQLDQEKPKLAKAKEDMLKISQEIVDKLLAAK